MLVKKKHPKKTNKDPLRLVSREQVVPGTAEGAYFWWGSSYAWSPDRRFIAYAQADRIGYVRLQDGKRTELHRFPPLRTYTWWVWVPQLSWSPDSRFLTSVIHGPSLTNEPPEDSQVFDVWVFDDAANLVDSSFTFMVTVDRFGA